MGKTKTILMKKTDIGNIQFIVETKGNKGMKQIPKVSNYDQLWFKIGSLDDNNEVKISNESDLNKIINHENIQIMDHFGEDINYDFSDYVNYTYEDITDHEVLGDPPLSMKFLSAKDEGLISGMGIRKIKFTFNCKTLNLKDFDKKFIWRNWNGEKKFDNPKDVPWAENVEFNSQENIMYIKINTNDIECHFFDLNENEKNARFSGDLILTFEDEAFEYKIFIPIEIYFTHSKVRLSSDFASIDFGTSSTCVAVKDGNKAKLLPLNSQKETKKSTDYENPTDLMICNWDDLCNSWLNNFQNDNFPHILLANDIHDQGAYIDGFLIKKILQQRKISVQVLESMILNLKNISFDSVNDVEFFQNSSFRSLKDKNDERPEIKISTNPDKQDERNFDPISFYGYLVGRAINRAKHKSLYNKFYLTIPVKFDEEVRKKLLESLKYGLRLALPESLHESMIVKYQYEEPVAFLGSVLNKSENNDKDKIEFETNDKPKLFAVYDFGGGTLDFSCGLWRKVKDDDDNSDFRDFIIDVIATGGNSMLGGEKIIDCISNNLYINNIEKMNEKKIPIQMNDYFKWNDRPHYEHLLNYHGKPNKIRISEQLSRDYWYNYNFEHKTINTLIDYENKVVENIELDCPPSIEKEITTIVKDSVKEFRRFIDLNFSFDENKKLLEKYSVDYNISDVFIFLAGNASKSEKVNEAFLDYFKNCYDKDGNAKRIQRISENTVDGINPKTAVALGQIYFDINNVGVNFPNATSDKSNFIHNILKLDGNIYKTIIYANRKYKSWVYYGKNNNWKDKDLYFTDCIDSELIDSVDDPRVNVFQIPNGDKGHLYIRPIGLSKIEYIIRETQDQPEDDLSGEKIIIKKRSL